MMAKFKKIKLNKIKFFWNNIIKALAEHGFLTFIFLFILSLVLGIFIFFKCSVMIEAPAQKSGDEKSFKLEERAYQGIKEEWAKRKGVFSQTEAKKYSNPFLH